MAELKVGDVVKSVAGRDKEKILTVVKVEKNVVYVADGKLRRVERPKKKNKKHLIKLDKGISLVHDRLNKGEALGNKTLKKALSKNTK